MKREFFILFIEGALCAHWYVREGHLRFWLFDWHRVWINDAADMANEMTAGGFQILPLQWRRENRR